MIQNKKKKMRKRKRRMTKNIKNIINLGGGKKQWKEKLKAY